LQAVRSGPWKLAIVPQPDAKARYERGRAIARATDAKVIEELRKGKPFTPVLFNLDKDISETTNVAAQHPDVVAKLQGFVHQMDADLGVKGGGPGIRPHGIVAKPQPLSRRTPLEYD
jgi:arylsulfatase